MSYLTQALVDHDMAVRQLHLHDVYDWHQFVWRAFSDNDDKTRRFLTRLDRRRDGFRLLVLSVDKPTCPKAADRAGCVWQTRAISPEFFEFRRFRFQLRANPTKRDNATRKRVPLRTEGELLTWMDRKAEQSGFAVDVDELRVNQEGREWFRIASRKMTGFHHAVDFAGVLSVTDLTRFLIAFNRGIGSAKAFGFGMLTLLPISRDTV